MLLPEGTNAFYITLVNVTISSSCGVSTPPNAKSHYFTNWHDQKFLVYFK